MATTFIEITKSDHGHGGPGWEFGTCLWSPARNRAGGDRYSIMRVAERPDARAAVEGTVRELLAGLEGVTGSSQGSVLVPIMT